MTQPDKSIGSLFAGIGGFDLGFERVGFETKWQVEIDGYCQKILARHFPKAKRYADITQVTGLEKVDVITGGFPCQDLSVAGKRQGLAGKRSGLFYELKRIVSEVRPTWIVVENVPGLLSSNRGKDFGLVLFHLEECGYGLSWRILDSRYFGVAQRRRRVFIVGYFGKPCPPEILFEPEGVSGNLKKKRKAGSETAGTITAGFDRRGWADYNEHEQLVARAVTTSTQRWKPDQETFVLQDYKQNGGAMSGVTTSLRLGHTKGNERQGGIRKEFVGALEATNTCGFAVTPTLSNSGAGTERVVGAPFDADRVREIAGIPRQVDTPDGPRYRALGNAVTVNVAEWIAKRIMNFEANQ